MTNKDITIYDIAKDLGLSASTVSRALKENKRINKNTREKVIKHAEKVGYQANTFASSLRNKETKTIGIIVPRLDSKLISSCLAGAEKAATEKGYSLLISQSLEDLDKEKINTQSMFMKRVDGLLVSLTQKSNDIKHFTPIINKGTPVLFFDRTPSSNKYSTILIDNFSAAKEATEHLINQGCKNITHITIDSNNAVYKDRKRGFESAIENSPTPIDSKIIYVDYLDIENGRKAAQQFNKKSTDGIFVANDQAAIGCMKELQRKDIKIPDDIAIIGFNNDPTGQVISPELSTVNYPAFEMGTIMTNNIIEHILGNADINLANKILLKYDLIIRESSKRK